MFSIKEGGIATCETVLNSMPEAERLCRMSGLPLRFTSAEKEIAAQLMGKIYPLFPLALQQLNTLNELAISILPQTEEKTEDL